MSCNGLCWLPNTSVLKRGSFTLVFRRGDPSFPAFFPRSCSPQAGHGCPDHDGFFRLLPKCNPPFSRCDRLYLLYCCVSMRGVGLCWFLGLHRPFLKQEANTTGVLLTIDNPIQYLFAAFSRHLSRYDPLLDRPAVLRWLCADETYS